MHSTHQFETGDFGGDGFDSVAIRRGVFIAFNNVSPDTRSEGDFVTGHWDKTRTRQLWRLLPSLIYRRNGLDGNSRVYQTQSLPTINTTTVSVSHWRIPI